jgi:hypothetical protein
MGQKTQNSYGKVKRKKEHLFFFFCGYTLKCDMTATADKNPGKTGISDGKNSLLCICTFGCNTTSRNKRKRKTEKRKTEKPVERVTCDIKWG